MISVHGNCSCIWTIVETCFLEEGVSYRSDYSNDVLLTILKDTQLVPIQYHGYDRPRAPGIIPRGSLSFSLSLTLLSPTQVHYNRGLVVFLQDECRSTIGTVCSRVRGANNGERKSKTWCVKMKHLYRECPKLGAQSIECIECIVCPGWM